MIILLRIGTTADDVSKSRDDDETCPIDGFKKVYLVSPQEMDWAFVAAASRDLGDDAKMEEWRRTGPKIETI